MKVKRLEEFADTLAEKYPRLYRACYPRHITVPEGYTDPRYYSTTMCGNALVVQDPFKRGRAYENGYTSTLSLIAARVPVYFIADEFAKAVANTELPNDFKFAEIKWPLEAQLFVLSDNFCRGYFGCFAPFLAVARGRAGEYPGVLPRKLPETEITWRTLIYREESIFFDHPFCGSEVPSTYNASFALKDGISAFKDAPLHDATNMERLFHGDKADIKGALAEEDEKKFTDLALMLTVKLLLLIAERPGLIEHGKVMRHALVTQQRQVKLPELVSPNIIGRTYHIPRQRAEAAPGTDRAKPKFLYRRGHMAWVAKKFKNQEFIPVDSMPRQVDGSMDFDKAGDVLSNKFRACHERKWIEGIIFE